SFCSTTVIFAGSGVLFQIGPRQAQKQARLFSGRERAGVKSANSGLNARVTPTGYPGCLSNLLRRWADVFAQDCLSPKGPPTTVTVARENPIVGLRVTGAFPPLQQCVCEDRMNGHGFLR